MAYFTYILECADKTLYVGSKNDIEKRLHQHNNLKSGAHYTKIRRPVILKYKEEFDYCSSAITVTFPVTFWFICTFTLAVRGRKISTREPNLIKPISAPCFTKSFSAG